MFLALLAPPLVPILTTSSIVEFNAECQNAIGLALTISLRPTFPR